MLNKENSRSFKMKINLLWKIKRKIRILKSLIKKFHLKEFNNKMDNINDLKKKNKFDKIEKIEICNF